MDHPTPKPSVKIRCPAKLNLTLAVGPPRHDGLHPIASVMAALDFGDDLQLTHAHSTSRFDRRFATDAPKPQPIDWAIENDLIFRAHAAMVAEVGRSLPIDCELVKRIPAGSGLGGGSSDAAGMLVALREMFGLAIADDRLLELGQSLGADVAFLVGALLGHRAAVVTGIGEVINPLDNLPGFHVVLVFPKGACPTADVYQAFDQARGHDPIPAELPQAWASDKNLPAAHNDLTQAAIRVCPDIAEAAAVVESLGMAPRLTGSGSALFAVVQSQPKAIAIAKAVQQAGAAACPAGYDPSPPSR